MEQLRIVSPWREPERILCFGAAGTGKSNLFLQIAEACPDSQFHVLDNDKAYGRLLEEGFPQLSNVHHHIVRRSDFEQYTSTLEGVLEDVTRHDWIGLDMLDPTWDAVQEWFIDQIFDESIDEYLLAAKQKKNKGKRAGDDLDRSATEIDWPFVKKVYQKRIHEKIVEAPCNVYAATSIKAIDEKDTKDVKNWFGVHGVRPSGNKDMPHLFHTVLLLVKQPRQNVWEMTTVKDRGKRGDDDHSMQSMEWDNFALDYLVEVAGWKKEEEDTPKPKLTLKKKA